MHFYIITNTYYKDDNIMILKCWLGTFPPAPHPPCFCKTKGCLVLCTHAPGLSPPFSVDFNGNWPPQPAALYFAPFIPTLPWHIPECSCMYEY